MDGCSCTLGCEEKILHIADDVTWLAVDGEGVGAAGDVFQRAKFWFESGAQLIKIGDLEAGATFDPATVGCQVPKQQANQGGFADTIRPDNANLVPAHDRRAEIADEGLPADAVIDPFGFDHDLAGQVTLLHLHTGLARLLATLGVFASKLLERAHASLVACASGFDALAYPGFFLSELFVFQRVAGGFGFQRRSLTTQIGVVIAGPITQIAAVELDNTGGQFAQKRTVVRDEDQRQTRIAQILLKPINGRYVKVVGGLIEQQNVGLGDQRACQQNTTLESAGEFADLCVRVELHARERLGDFLAELPSIGSIDPGL